MDFSMTPRQSSSDGESEEEEEQHDSSQLLDADHPLMQRFQQALKDHLQKVKGQLEDEILDLDHKIKEKNDSIAEVGAKLFDLQNDIEKQRDQLDKYSFQILEVSEKRRGHEENAARWKTEYLKKDSTCKEMKRKTNEITQEIASMKALESEIAKWNAEVSSLKAELKFLLKLIKFRFKMKLPSPDVSPPKTSRIKS